MTTRHKGGHLVPVEAFGGGNCSGAIDVATTLTHHGTRQDFDTETFIATGQGYWSESHIAAPLTTEARGLYESTAVTHALTAEGFDASEDGTGRGCPLVAIPILEAGARTGKSTTDPRAGMGVGEDGDPMYTLQSGKQHAVAFHAHQDPIAAYDVMLPLEAKQGQCVAFRAAGQDGFTPSEIAPPLTQTDGGGTVPTVAFNLRGRDGGSQPEPADVASLRSASGGSSRSYVAQTGVRRITPTEAERLQGFPDHYTLITFRGKPAADGPRYKALGNSMCVNSMAWLGRRIEAALAGKAVA
jgi:DNA (cytosine-5)-methyltransferase 1